MLTTFRLNLVNLNEYKKKEIISEKIKLSVKQKKQPIKHDIKIFLY